VRLVLSGAVLVVLAGFAAAAGVAARQPTLTEREAITRALPAVYRQARVECLFIEIRISTRDSRYAEVVPQPLNWRAKPACPTGGNGFEIYKRKAGRWRSIYAGSVPPPCSLGVPRDLQPCAR
jgi:hypothetical protein